MSVSTSQPAHEAGFRIEQDAIGPKQIPLNAYYGIQTQRAKENFHITGLAMHPDIIDSLVEVKKAAAIANCKVGLLTEPVKNAIVSACDEILRGELHDFFIVDPVQGGAGTSLNMNANEVIANRAIELMGGKKGDYALINPNDHVNCGQSTNDVIPSAGRLTAVKLLEKARMELYRLQKAFDQKADEFDDVIKMGRTQLQDAVPIRLGQEFRAYGAAVRRDILRFENAKYEMCELNLGGTAIGTGMNAHPDYVKTIVKTLDDITHLGLRQAENLIDATQNLDAFVVVSGIIRTCAVSLSKISNDLRLMSSGPRTGIGEIILPARQSGSSIMPGKVNPVIPEVVNQVAFNIIGNDTTITMAVEAGQMELNAFEPIIFYCLFQSIDTLRYAVNTLVDNCVLGIVADRTRCKTLVEGSLGIITALCPIMGYQQATELVKRAVAEGKDVREVILETGTISVAQLDEILDLRSMTEPGLTSTVK